MHVVEYWHMYTWYNTEFVGFPIYEDRPLLDNIAIDHGELGTSRCDRRDRIGWGSGLIFRDHTGSLRRIHGICLRDLVRRGKYLGSVIVTASQSMHV